jgi:Mn2+/Fe2+ NRAMP family transporter
MKSFFSKLGFRKMDEMGKDISIKAQRNALIYVLLVLVIWSFYESFKVYTQHTSLNSAPSFLLVTTSFVLILSQLVLKKRAIKGDDEYKDTTPILKIIVVGVIIAAIIISIGAWIVFSGI